MTFLEAVDTLPRLNRPTLQIFATDLDADAINQARQGLYGAGDVGDLSGHRLRRFFSQERDSYRVSKEIRELIIFAPQNLVMDPPFTKLDLISCRNLMIYLEPGLQRNLLNVFHYSLNPDAFLILGSAETAGPAVDRFVLLAGKSRIYRRRDVKTRPEFALFPTVSARKTGTPATILAPFRDMPPPANLQTLTHSLLLEHHAPAAVLCTDKGDIVYISGKTGNYLEPASGKANLNVFAMARVGLDAPLSEAFAKALRRGKMVTVGDVIIKAPHGGRRIELTIRPLSDPASLRGLVLIVFKDLPKPIADEAVGRTKRGPAPTVKVVSLNRELRRCRDELQATRDEMQASQEELSSTNEELQSANEELQSANEELTTSKEEMQSMNEELQTLNHELQAKLEELTTASDDMKNLLNSTEIATLFLDAELRIRRFTPQAAGLIKLIPTDLGRPITDLVSNLEYAALAEDAQEVLRTLIFTERRISARDGRWFRVRIMPYRTQEDRIDGVVITFIETSALRALESAQQQCLALLRPPAGSSAAAHPASVADMEALLHRVERILEASLAPFAAQVPAPSPPKTRRKTHTERKV